MEVSVEDVKALFTQFLTSPELKEVGKIISKRLGRKLEAYDIWYDGFKPRSNLDEAKLDAQIQKLYPNAEAFRLASPPCSHIWVLPPKEQMKFVKNSRGCRARIRTRVGCRHEGTTVPSSYPYSCGRNEL